MPFEVSELTWEELYSLRREVKEKIKEKKEERIIARIEEEVKEKGYSCSPRYWDDIKGLQRTLLPYYLWLNSWDRSRRHKKDIHVSDVSDYQLPWVERLDFGYQPRDKDDYIIVGDWDCDDWESPCSAKAVMYITVYYKHLDKIPDKFVVISEGYHLSG